MKMLALLSVFHLLTLCGTEISAVPNRINNATVGEQVLFPVHNHCGGAQYEVTFLTKSPTHTKLATWGFNISNKHPLYENRLKRRTNDSVVLYNVQINDTKLYELQIDCYSKIMTETNEKMFDLRVFEAVSKPLMTMICSASNITLSCSVSMGNNVIFHWEKQSLSGAINGTYDGAELVIDHVTEQEQYMYRCIAENLISNASSDPWTIEQCNMNNSKDQKLLWNISTIAVPIFLLVLTLVVYICYKIKLTASDKGGNTATPERNEEISYLRDGSIEATYITRIDLS